MSLLGQSVITLAGINFEVIFQLTMLGMILLAGPIIVFLLFLRGGDL
jgi:hypothetical protein